MSPDRPYADRATARTARGEVAAFAVLTALGGAVLATSFGYGILLEGNRVGPGFLPMVLGMLLLLLGAGQLAGRLRALRAGSGESNTGDTVSAVPAETTTTTEPTETGAETGTDVLGRDRAYRTRQLWLVVATVLVTLVLVPYLGFLVGFGLMVLFITVVAERRSWPASVVIAAAAVGIVYGVFAVFLHVPMPGGLLNLVAGR